MLGRCPGEGTGDPPQCSGLENATDCIVHGVTKSQTRLSDFHFQDKEGVVYLSVIVVGYSPHCVWLFVTPRTVVHQAPLPMGFSRPECWSGLPCPSPGHLPHPGIKPMSPALASGFWTTEQPGKGMTEYIHTHAHTCTYSEILLSHKKWIK